ncbi:GNS1/SUR4 membrane protein [Neoconidiobolus thromboides FSU 785]|nr:GNS1/SUR4 membrane protein [Neoconidiobolus thromboides FSU 785]
MSALTSLSFQHYFEIAYEKVIGNPASEFRFVEGVTPLSTYREVFMVCLTYLVVIFGGQAFMKNQKPIQLSFLFQLHNAFLTIASLALFLLFAENVIPFFYNEGPFASICSKEIWTQRLELLYYINYLTKFYELIDTVFLVLRKKKLEFLHWYHHSMTALLCFSQLSGQSSVSWVPVILNLFVHIFMYYYYLLSTFKIKVWWKKYITVLQITQFIIDLSVVYFCLYTYFTFHYYPQFPTFGDCNGKLPNAIFGAGLLSSYLLLFIEFFYKAYSKPKAVKENKGTTEKAEEEVKEKVSVPSKPRSKKI